MSQAPACPFCGEPNRVAPVAQFAGQLITAQWRCSACHSFYEAIRADFDAPVSASPGPDNPGCSDESQQIY